MASNCQWRGSMQASSSGLWAGQRRGGRFYAILTAGGAAQDRMAASRVIAPPHGEQLSSSLSPTLHICAFAAVHVLCNPFMKQSA